MLLTSNHCMYCHNDTRNHYFLRIPYHERNINLMKKSPYLNYRDFLVPFSREHLRKGSRMIASNFSEEELAGKSEVYQHAVDQLHEHYGFDFVALGLTTFVGAPLKWVYGAGASSERYRRIVLSPGHGIGGITIKSGKPMMFLDIDNQIDPREYSSYPIVFAEDLRSFCALPLTKDQKVVAVILCAYRSSRPENEEVFRQFIEELHDTFLGLSIIADDFLYTDAGIEQIAATREKSITPSPSALAQTIKAQEDERRRISRELHDGIAQELLTVSFLIRECQVQNNSTEAQTLAEASAKIDAILDELHNLSVELRPSSLDHLGLLPALRSQAVLYEKTYGIQSIFSDRLIHKRFNHALETQIYRICQEAILNSCKYSGVDLVMVDLFEADDWICITITDEGSGFNTENPEIKGSGCGLSGMKERAEMIGATLTIESDEAGTQVKLLVPVVYEEEV